MTLREFIDQIEKVRGIAQTAAEKMEVIIEDDAGVEFNVENIYYVSGTGLGIDIKKRMNW